MRGNDFQRSVVHGELALSYLKSNDTPAYPQNYELWYTYAAGFNPQLNTEINEALAAQGRLDPIQTAQFYDRHLSPARLRERVGEVSSSVADRINEVLSLLDVSEKSVGGYGKALRAASDGLVSATSHLQAREIIERVIAATVEVESKNADLERQLGESLTRIEALHDSLEAIRFESMTDQLTGLANRKHFDESLESAVAVARAEDRPLCLGLCDIDHFKLFNDTYGHQTGDQVLRLVGTAIRAHVDRQDLAARYGGEEFAIIMEGKTLSDATRMIDQIRRSVIEKELVKRSTGESLGRVTMSGGVTQYVESDSTESLIERADQLLYEAKRSGRNRVLSGPAEPDLTDAPAVA
ncbi:GGDEF domain-containing protein [Lutibaculum baratangense]|uniref:diguanylate cyclase n=1 Tax=Lutibaculum baratangense AMV1 TaxID=631454 RepID=V4TG47_9HYPH|nr:GGDEF domain-containing protein [Lutibaculum baratangense]ESR25098.1 GGDEF domain protein [Lutibaculum baratangense AMV1]